MLFDWVFIYVYAIVQSMGETLCYNGLETKMAFVLTIVPQCHETETILQCFLIYMHITRALLHSAANMIPH